ncbi:protein ACCELERATED CELL DEATH 6-like [Eucalyptus grandis]|uniref:protein ACCELERATED CELL DEATH 6-like n=1 Tax=Eucalyptus grandis TaxID=71139 RepID=UPI00192ECDD9|nr:protein ACCELERATED CELL DEATH 6-like [Eucalyptus grandis]
MEVKLSIGGYAKNSIEEFEWGEGEASVEMSEDERDSLKEKRIRRFRRERIDNALAVTRMNNALAATRTAEGQDPTETYAAAQTLADVIEGNEVEGFIYAIEWLADQTDLFAIFNFLELQGGSLLHVAAAAGKNDILRLLLDLVSDHRHIAAQNDSGYTPLHIAAKTGNSGAVKTLIHRARNLSNVEGKNWIMRMQNEHGNTPLHEAVLGCHFNVVQLLLEEDLESVYLKNKAEKSPLYLALYAREPKITDLLFSRSLDPSKIEGFPPVHGAIGCPNDGTYLNLLVENIYYLELLIPGILKQILTTNMKLFAMTDSSEGNVFHFAAYTGQGRVFDELLGPKTKYLANKQDKNGDLPIHIASKKGYVDIVQKLHSLSKLLNRKGQTILHVAAKYGQNSVVRYILGHPELGKLINEIDHTGNTPLHLATKHSQPAALVPLVLDKNVEPSIRNHESLTARNIAVDQFRRVYASREALALLVLQPISDSTTELLIRRPENRDKVSCLVYSPKDIPKFDLFKDKIDSLLVVATLVATVTFAAGFAVPGGFNSSDKYDRGMATMLDKRLFQAFMICNTIAMFSSMITVINLLYAQERDFHMAAAALNFTIFSLNIALSAMSAAFLTGVSLIVGKLPWLANIIFYLGLVFLLIISSATWWECLLFIRSYGRRRPIHRLKCWLILGFIYLLRAPTYILDDEEEDGKASRTSASQPPDGAGETKR